MEINNLRTRITQFTIVYLIKQKITHMTTTKQQTQNYFETLIQLQPETAVKILMNLYSREINVEEWINITANDIIDTEN